MDDKTHVRLDATQTLTESGMLVGSKMHTTKGEPADTYTLRLPLHFMKAAAVGLAEMSSVEGSVDDDDEESGEYIQIQVQTANVKQVEETFWRQLVELVDWDNSGTLDEEVCYGLLCSNWLQDDQVSCTQV